MADISQAVLGALAGGQAELETRQLALKLDVDHQQIVGAMGSIQALAPDCLTVTPVSENLLALTAEGQSMVDNGSHEARVFEAIPTDGIVQSELLARGEFAKIGLSKALAARWITLEKKGEPVVKRAVESIVDSTQQALQAIQAAGGKAEAVDANMLKELKKRKLVDSNIIKSFKISKGPNFVEKLEKLETDLTPEMLATGDWKDKGFKPYNFKAMGVAPVRGHLHPLLKVRAEFRAIFLEMGFTEMPTNNFVESSFWNFDSLFQPQQHPARDSHDTFFIKDPEFCPALPEDAYVKRVHATHETGGDTESLGYRYDWSLDEARKNILRTHTTAVSARMLKKLADEKPFKPSKYFSIDRVFRNETLDATHLAEFHQIEGVIVDYNLTLGDLIGVLYQFFHKALGIKKLRFKPAYNPYTEPSMEIFSYHEGLGRWVEIGNSGMFRPEMLEPMGLPKDVTAIAWGLSLERPTMIKYGIDNIRELVGHKVDLSMVYRNPVCRLP